MGLLWPDPKKSSFDLLVLFEVEFLFPAFRLFLTVELYVGFAVRLGLFSDGFVADSLLKFDIRLVPLTCMKLQFRFEQNLFFREDLHIDGWKKEHFPSL